MSFPVQAQNSHLPLSWCLLDFFEAEEKSWISSDGFGEEEENDASKNTPGQLLLKHGAARKNIHHYFSNLESRKCCLSLTGGKTTAINKLKLVNLDVVDSHDEGFKSKKNCSKIHCNTLSNEYFQVFRDALLCALCPVLCAPDPPPSPTMSSSFSHRISETASDISSRTEIDGTTMIPLETLNDLLRRTFNLDESIAYEYRKQIREELGKKTATEILAEELASRLAVVENDCHPFYHPHNFLDGGAYDFWQVREKEIINRLLKKFWHSSFPSPQGSYFLASKHEEYRCLLNLLIRYESGFTFCECVDHPLIPATVRPLSSAAQRLLKEFAFRYGIGELYCRISYLEISVQYFEKDIIYLRQIKFLLDKLAKDLEFQVGGTIFIVKNEWQLLLDILSQLQGECSLCFSKIGCLSPEITTEVIACLILIFQYSLQIKRLLTGEEEVKIRVLLNQYIQYSIGASYARYKFSVHQEFPKENSSCLSAKQINVLMLKIRDEVKYFATCFQGVFRKYFNVSKLVTQEYYKYLMDDVILLGREQVKCTKKDTIDLTLLSLVYRLHTLDLDWVEYISSSMQLWRPVFFRIFLLWIKVVEIHSEKIVKHIMATDKLTALLLPPNLQTKILRRGHFKSFTSGSQKSFVQSYNSAFDSIPPSRNPTPSGPSPFLPNNPNNFVRVPCTMQEQSLHLLGSKGLEDRPSPTSSLSSLPMMPPLILTDKIGPYLTPGENNSKYEAKLLLPQSLNERFTLKNSNGDVHFSKSWSSLSPSVSDLLSLHSSTFVPGKTDEVKLSQFKNIDSNPFKLISSVDNVTPKNESAFLNWNKSNCRNEKKIEQICQKFKQANFLSIDLKKNSPCDIDNEFDNFIVERVHEKQPPEILLLPKKYNYSSNIPFTEKLDFNTIEQEEDDSDSGLGNGCSNTDDLAFQPLLFQPILEKESDSDLDNPKTPPILENSLEVLENNLYKSKDSCEVFHLPFIEEESNASPLTTSNETSESNSSLYLDSSDSESCLADLKSQLKDLLQQDKLFTIFVSSASSDILVLINRIINFGKSLCDTICPYDAKKPSDEGDETKLSTSELREEAVKVLFDTICTVVCTFADNLLCMDLCATPKTFAQENFGNYLVNHFEEQKGKGNIWGCRHMKETFGKCLQYYKKNCHFLCDKFEPITQEMALRLNNILEVNKCLQYFKQKLNQVIIRDIVKNNEGKLRGDVNSPDEGFAFQEPKSYSEEGCKTALEKCQQYLLLIMEIQVKLMAYKLNLFCEEAMEFLTSLPQSSLSVSDRFHPLIDFLVKHLAALREWLKQSTFKVFINELWKLLVQDLKVQKENLLLTKNIENVPNKAQGLLQCIAVLIEFFSNKGHGLDEKKMMQDIEYIINYLNDLACEKDTTNNSFLQQMFLFPELREHPEHLQRWQNYLKCMQEELHEMKKCFSGQQLTHWLKKNTDDKIPWWEILGSQPSTSSSFPAAIGTDEWAEHGAEYLIRIGLIGSVDDEIHRNEFDPNSSKVKKHFEKGFTVVEIHDHPHSPSSDDDVNMKETMPKLAFENNTASQLSTQSNYPVGIQTFRNTDIDFYYFSCIKEAEITQSNMEEDGISTTRKKRGIRLAQASFRTQTTKKSWSLSLMGVKKIKSWLQFSLTHPSLATCDSLVPIWN